MRETALAAPDPFSIDLTLREEPGAEACWARSPNHCIFCILLYFQWFLVYFGVFYCIFNGFAIFLDVFIVFSLYFQ